MIIPEKLSLQASEVGPKRGPMWATWPWRKPVKVKKRCNSGKNASFQHVALSLQNWPGFGPAWARAAQLGPKLRYLGPNWKLVPTTKATQMDPKLKPFDARGSPSTCRNIGALCVTGSHQVGPSGDTTWGTLLQSKRHRWENNVENTSENRRFEDF